MMLSTYTGKMWTV